MNFKNIGNSMTRLGKRLLFETKRKSPEICVAGAIIFGAGALVMTFAAARKMDKALEEPKTIIATAKDMEISEKYTEEDRQHDITLGTVRMVWEGVKLFTPATLMACMSCACVLISHRKLSRRNAELAAANGILAKQVASLTKSLEDKVGKEEAYRLRYEDKLEEAEETMTDENGEEKTVKVKKPKAGYEADDLGRFFDEISPEWKKDPQYNLMTLRNILFEFQERLKRDGVVFLNDIYERLGHEKTQAGYQYGWIYRKGTDPTTTISFGPVIGDREAEHKLILENQRYIWLEFNCERIEWEKTPFRKV